MKRSIITLVLVCMHISGMAQGGANDNRPIEVRPPTNLITPRMAPTIPPSPRIPHPDENKNCLDGWYRQNSACEHFEQLRRSLGDRVA